VSVNINEQGEESKDTAQFTDVLTFLCSQKRTGKLLISEKEREGEVFFTDGKITHAQFAQCIGLQALLFMLSWETGKYNFTPKKKSDQTTIEMETTQILSLLSKRVQEWNRINRDHSLNLNVALYLLPQARGTIRLKREEWNILAKIDGIKSLKNISDEMYLPPLDVVKIMQRFRKAGLIGEGSRYPESAYAAFNEDFLTALERELNLAVGPIAPILFEEALKDMEETSDPLVTDKMGVLLETLSNAIPIKEHRVRFQQAARSLALEFASDQKLSQKEKDHEKAKK
jgi:hypothetical protein